MNLKLKLAFQTFFSVLVFAGLTACSPSNIQDSPESVSPTEDVSRAKLVEPEARNLYGQAERAFFARDYENAKRLFTQVKAKYPRSKAYAFSTYRLGIIEYYNENYQASVREFEYYVTKAPRSDLTFDATYNWAAAEYQLQRYDRANQALNRLKIADVMAQGPRRAETVFQLAARIAAASQNFPGVVAAHGLLLQLPLEDAVREAAEKKVVDALEGISSPARLEQLISEVSDPFTQNRIRERLLALQNPQAPPQSAPVVNQIPVGPNGAPIPGAVALPSGGSGERTHIGVLLPLSGKWAPYGKRALDGILLASRVFGGSDSGLRLFVKDTKSSPIVAQAALEELVADKNVIAVIGPLQWKEAQAASERAQQLGVLNLSLAAREGLSERSAFTFQNALMPRVQLESLVDYVIKEKNFSRFAILAPNNPFGNDMTKHFWDLVERAGGKVVELQKYPPEEKDFQSYIRDMVGVGDYKNRAMEWKKLQEWAKEQKTKTGKEPKIQLPPIIDFDALFIPDSPTTLAQIAPSLAYFDVEGVTLLGITEWNSDAFYKRAARYVDHAAFPAGLHLRTRNLKTREFIKLYQNAYGNAPDLLAAQAYEAMMLVSEAIQRSGSDDRNQLVNTLAQLKGFETPLGVVTFDATRTALRKLTVLSVEKGGEVYEH